jgi:methylation protein EvaC
MRNSVGIKQAACCSFCNSMSMIEIMDFGEVALAGGFLRANQFTEELNYPLRLFFCHDCYAVQVINKVSASVLFKDYFYFSSSIQTLRDHFIDYAREVTTRFLKPESATVIEFGCNDGVLLKPLADQNIKTVIGVDPATNIVSTINDPRINIINDFFTEDVAQDIVQIHGQVDMVVANNVYAHIPDIQGITHAVRDVLSDDGVFIFEVHYLGNVINELQYDMVYHEHLYYYSLLSVMKHFERYGMMVFDVKQVPIHAGSMRFYVCKKGSKHGFVVSPAVTQLQNEELAKGFHRPETFVRFATDIAERKTMLMELLNKLKKDGCTIAGYGASGRANTMIQYCGINFGHLDYMIDDAPAKAGFFTPGSHFEIHPSSILDQPSPPDYLLIFAWSFFDEIAKRSQKYLDGGGRMIVPLPEVKIFPEHTGHH